MTDPGPVPIPTNTPVALAFAHEGELLFLGLQLVGVLVPLAFLATGWGARLAAGIGRLTGGRRWLTLTLFAWIFLALWTAASAPLLYLRDVARWARFAAQGFPPLSLGECLTGRATGLLFMALLAAALLWIPFRLIERRPRTWPVILTLVVLPALTAALVLSQVALMPMTTPFHPVQGPIAARIHALAARCGAGGVPVLVGGGDTTVVGLGPTSRILVGATDIETETPDQLMTTLAHELKHHLMGDNWLAVAVVGALILAGALLVQLPGGMAIRLWGPRMGLASLHEPAALPLIVLILVLGWGLAGLPVYNAVQKSAEFEADRFALELTHDNRAFSEFQASVGKLPWRMNEEDWFTSVFLDNHPSQADRVRFGNSYRPWAQGRRDVYAGVCRPSA
jgi:Zn-dependent protease with chaperone function